MLGLGNEYIPVYCYSIYIMGDIVHYIKVTNPKTLKERKRKKCQKLVVNGI